MLRRWYCRMVVTLRADRGEGPVPYIIMVAIMAAAAVLIAVGVRTVGQTWLNQLTSVK